jgi:hypothetical protein
MRPKTVATLTMRGVPRMTVVGRHAIAQWLRQQARTLEKDGRLYAERHTSRYRYE